MILMAKLHGPLLHSYGMRLMWMVALHANRGAHAMLSQLISVVILKYKDGFIGLEPGSLCGE